MKAVTERVQREAASGDFPESGKVPCVPAAEPSSLTLTRMLATLLGHYGEQNWWPAKSPFEVMVGAVLVQNTQWRNAEKAIDNLRASGMLSLEAVYRSRSLALQRLIRPSGFYRQKAATLKRLAAFIHRQYAGSIPRMAATATGSLRAQLLSLKGLGPETVDAILLYALGHEVVVVDTYGKRVLERHGLPAKLQSKVQQDIVNAIPSLRDIHWHQRDPRHPPSRMSRRRVSPVAKTSAEIHAAFVRVGNEFCGKRPACAGCPLEAFLPRNAPPCC